MNCEWMNTWLDEWMLNRQLDRCFRMWIDAGWIDQYADETGTLVGDWMVDGWMDWTTA